MMRKSLMAGLTAAALLNTACPSRTDTTDAGKTGTQNTDSGTQDSGTDTGNNGLPTGATAYTISSLKAASPKPYKAWVELDNVVVNEVIYAKEGTGTPPGWRADFWVQDPAATAAAPAGLFISKFYSDVDNDYLPVPGDNISLTGFFNTVTDYVPQTGYRYVIEDAYSAKGDGGDGNLHIVVNSQGARPADITTPAGFGDADGGSATPNSSFGGVRVHIPGPLTITNYSPTAFSDPQLSNPGYGFEVTGGILVNTTRLRAGSFALDGGAATCDYANGSGTHTFPNGISGVWDTYSYAPCLDGGVGDAACGYYGYNFVPGSVYKYSDGGIAHYKDGGVETNNYTYALYPENCSDVAAAQ